MLSINDGFMGLILELRLHLDENVITRGGKEYDLAFLRLLHNYIFFTESTSSSSYAQGVSSFSHVIGIAYAFIHS